MEININCDLGEKSKFHSIENDPKLLSIVNSANIACGYHAGDEETMDMVIKILEYNITLLKIYQILEMQQFIVILVKKLIRVLIQM